MLISFPTRFAHLALLLLLVVMMISACGNSSTTRSFDAPEQSAVATRAAELSIQAAVHATIVAERMQFDKDHFISNEGTNVFTPTILPSTPSRQASTLTPTNTPFPKLPPTQPATPQPTIPPLPTITPTPAYTFGPLLFCQERDFDQVTKRCTRSQDMFTGKIEIIYVSWNPSPDKVGSLFKRKWYLDDDKPFLITENANEYAYLAVDTRESLKPGSYLVELYVGDELVQTGHFVIK